MAYKFFSNEKLSSIKTQPTVKKLFLKTEETYNGNNK